MKELKSWVSWLLFVIAGLSSIIKEWLEAHPKVYFWFGTVILIGGLVEWFFLPIEWTTPHEDLVGIACFMGGFLIIALSFSPQS